MKLVPATLKRFRAPYDSAALGLALAFCLAAQGASAQSESSWSNQGLIYLLGPTLDGASGIGPIDTDVDMSASDVFETLDGAFLGMYRGEGERWGVMIDVVYMDLKADGSGDGGHQCLAERRVLPGEPRRVPPPHARLDQLSAPDACDAAAISPSARGAVRQLGHNSRGIHGLSRGCRVAVRCRLHCRAFRRGDGCSSGWKPP